MKNVNIKQIEDLESILINLNYEIDDGYDRFGAEHLADHDGKPSSVVIKANIQRTAGAIDKYTKKLVGIITKVQLVKIELEKLI